MGIDALVVTAGSEWNRVITALEVIDRTMNGKLQTAMEEGVKPAIAQAKADVRGLELPGGPIGRRGLQNVVASGVRMVSGSGPTINRIRVITAMPESDEAVIPRGMDRRIGWRHPVFGHRDRWVQQLGGSWFLDNMQDAERPIEENMTDVLEEQAHFVAEAGLGP